MNAATVGRILRDSALNGSAKQKYWAASRTIARLTRLCRRSNRAFLHAVAKDQLRFLLGTVRPIEGESRVRARAAVDWLLRAQDATADRGVSYGYFPCDDDGNGWRPSYPETTGYIIPSLLAFADRFDDDDVRRRALEMATWETEVQMPAGSVQGGPVCAPSAQIPASFNTGMVLHGYTAAYRATRDLHFLAAGRRAADFLVADQGADGHFRTHGAFVRPNRIHTYICLCGWALYRFAEDTGEDRYRRAAIAAIDAALRQQRSNGWFANNCIANPDAPLLHTIGYTLQGVLEVGILAGREDFVAAVQRGTDPLLERMSRNGFIHGRFYPDWEPAAFSSCLTGSAQLGVICYRLYEHTDAAQYRLAADRLVNSLKPLQVLESPNPALNGAIAGSFPVMGQYMTAGYPNWATKYFLDGLLLQDSLCGERRRADEGRARDEQLEQSPSAPVPAGATLQLVC